MLYSNKSKDDILVKQELDHLQTLNKNLKISHTLTRHDNEKHGDWEGLKGRVNEAMLKECGFPEPSANTLICFCGPAAFNKTCEQILASLGYDKDMMYKF
jgi:NAD(P)H-flavin reductase